MPEHHNTPIDRAGNSSSDAYQRLAESNSAAADDLVSRGEIAERYVSWRPLTPAELEELKAERAHQHADPLHGTSHPARLLRLAKALRDLVAGSRPVLVDGQIDPLLEPLFLDGADACEYAAARLMAGLNDQPLRIQVHIATVDPTSGEEIGSQDYVLVPAGIEA